MVRVAGREALGGTLWLGDGSDRLVSVARVLVLEAVLLNPPGEPPPFSNMLRVCVVAFLVASFIALEVTAGGGTPRRETGVWYDGGGVPLFAAATSGFTGVGAVREAEACLEAASDAGAGVARPE